MRRIGFYSYNVSYAYIIGVCLWNIGIGYSINKKRKSFFGEFFTFVVGRSLVGEFFIGFNYENNRN